MLVGIDISHWNEALVKSKGYRWLCDNDFVIMKATEGVNYVDKYMNEYVNMLYQGKTEPLMGFYHFARPDKGYSAIDECEWFLSKVRQFVGKAIFVIDVEAGALKVNNLDKWVDDFCMHFYNQTGVKPLIYCSEAEAHRFKKAAEHDCGLWVAKWSLNKPSAKKIKPFPFYALWQYDVIKESGHDLDVDYFIGNADQWRAYTKVGDING